uniref:Uncharacterized protein n=1 Tax=viral metagenome TaxID=1070528 RepID=A0A6C0LCS2_9ZZZZ
MDDNQRLQLQKMIKANNVEDQTTLIRELKHSHLLQNDINALLKLKARYNNHPDKVHEEAPKECNFLFMYYTDIYNKIRKDEIDLKILNRFLNVLRQIEDGQLDQHDGSFIIGTLLKEIYVDSALRKAEKLDEEHGDAIKEKMLEPVVNISWLEYKKVYM